jgi:hypothetical protein
MNEPLFKTAHQALSFAYNFSESTLNRPIMNRMADKYKRTGKGLSGMDAAGQAAFILRPLKNMPRLHQMVLIARFAPHGSECPCCGGPVRSLIWMGAIREISDAAVTQALTGHITMRALRDGIVMRYFGEEIRLGKLAKAAEVAPNTASKQNSEICRWLRGSRNPPPGEKQPIKGLEQIVMDDAEGVLSEAGIIGADY